MEGLLVLGGGAAWLALSAWIALRAARYSAKVAGRPWLTDVVFVVLWALLFLAPVADELIGKFQYERYCKEAEEVKIYGTVPVGQELYTVDGKWKIPDMSLPLEERNQAIKIKDSIIRWELDGLGTEAPAAIPIRYRNTKIYDVKTGRLLAELKSYSTRGGWLSRFLFERGGFFVEPQCYPDMLYGSKMSRGTQLEETILPFNKNVGDTK